MRWFSRPQPQEDDHGPTSIPFTEVDPDHEPDNEEGWSGPFSQWERDEDGWPIVPKRDDHPPLWKK